MCDGESLKTFDHTYGKRGGLSMDHSLRERIGNDQSTGHDRSHSGV